jgi:hypothetical protein
MFWNSSNHLSAKPMRPQGGWSGGNRRSEFKVRFNVQVSEIIAVFTRRATADTVGQLARCSERVHSTHCMHTKRDN